MIIGPAQPTQVPASADCTDVQLHQAIHDVGASAVARRPELGRNVAESYVPFKLKHDS
jgi:hypothetical protein